MARRCVTRGDSSRRRGRRWPPKNTWRCGGAFSRVLRHCVVMVVVEWAQDAKMEASSRSGTTFPASTAGANGILTIPSLQLANNTCYLQEALVPKGQRLKQAAARNKQTSRLSPVPSSNDAVGARDPAQTLPLRPPPQRRAPYLVNSQQQHHANTLSPQLRIHSTGAVVFRRRMCFRPEHKALNPAHAAPFTEG